MEKYKIVKKTRYVTKTEEYEEKIPMWYYRFLLWLFGYEEERLKNVIDGEKSQGWYKGLDMGQKTAHSVKEELMQRKLDELGYEVKCNFPMATLHPDINAIPDAPYDQNRLFEIVKKTIK